MNTSRTFYRGLICWIDDSFKGHMPSEEVDIWSMIFGKQSNKVFRLMDLSLKIATNKSDGERLLKDAAELVNRGVYVFCIMDMSLPIEDGGQIRPIHGLQLSKIMQELNLDGAILTSSSDIEREKQQHGISSIPYFKKTLQSVVVPESLSIYILSRLRNSIEWLSLAPLYESMDQKSRLLSSTLAEQQQAPISRKYYPFIGPFRDYVERLEYRPAPCLESTVLLRAPTDYSDEFIEKNILLLIAGWLERRKGMVRLHYFSNPSKSDTYGIGEDSNILEVIVLRIHQKTISANEFKELLTKSKNLDAIVYIVLPDGEASDEYLTQAYSASEVSYDDLPVIRHGEWAVREAVIRSSMQLVFMHSTVESSAGVLALATVFSDYPEALIDPVSWSVLIESEKLITQLSDPPEFLYEIETSYADTMRKLSDKELCSLQSGQPANPEKLIPVNIQSLQDPTSDIDLEELSHSTWIPRALKNWLTQSWHTPYGLPQSMSFTHFDNPNHVSAWEDFSLKVLLNLSNKYTFGKGSKQLDLVKSFLEQSAITKLSVGKLNEITSSEWSGLLTSRWPYRKFPLPIALNKLLKQAGRFTWIESDYFSLSQTLPSARHYHSFLAETVDNIGLILDWYRQIDGVLPFEWGFYLKKFLSIIENRSLPSLWADNKTRDKLYKDLMDFAHNSLPIVLISTYLRNIDVEDTDIVQGLKKIGKLLRELNGNGIMLDFIRRHRNPLDILINQAEAKQDRKVDVDLAEKLKELQAISSMYLETRFTTIACYLINNNSKHFKNVWKVLNDSEKAVVAAELGVGLEEVVLHFEKTKDDKAQTNFIRNRVVEAILEVKPNILDNYTIPGVTEEPDSILQHHNNLLSCALQGISKLDKTGLPIEFYHSISNYVCNLNSKAFLFEIDDCVETGSRSISSPIHAVNLSGKVADSFRVLMEKADTADGYRFLNHVTSLRNRGKGTLGVTVSLLEVEETLELLLYAVQGLASHVKVILTALGHYDYADKIIVPSWLYKKPPKLTKTQKAALEESVSCVFKETEYNLPHLGVPGSECCDKMTYVLNGKNHILEN